MKITIAIGNQRLTIVAQGDEYEIVLPERIERNSATQSEALSTSALKASPSAERGLLAKPLPVENSAEARQILNPKVLRACGTDLEMLQRVYDYVRKHDLCRFGEVCAALGLGKHSLKVKRALKILRVLGCVFKDSHERYTTRRVLPSCSTELLEKVLEIIEALPGITYKEIAQLLGHKASNGGISEAALYLAGIKKIRAIPEVQGVTVVWRHYPAKQPALITEEESP